jgi:hypothetical protein
MTDYNNCSGWGGILAGGLVGYLAGANGGGLFGNNCNRGNCGCGNSCEGHHHGYDEAKLNDIMSGQNTKAILDATIAGDSQVRSDIGALTKDVYALNVQQLINDQSEQRQIDNQFCKTREFIAADGTATRAAVNGFETRYLEDRIHDRDLVIAKLENQLTAAPLACGLAAVNAKLDSVIGCAGVRTCGSSCGCGSNYNPYTLPPLTGSSTVTRTYNPNVPVAGA